jgi:hypothetical protein
MAKKNEGPSHAWLYLGLGVVAAAGAAYLTWRYLLDESTKESIRSTTRNAVQRGREFADEAVDSGMHLGRDAVTRVRSQ